MAHDRYDNRDDRPRWSDERERSRDRGPGRRDERGFFERAGDEISSWFGDDEAEHRRERDHHADARYDRERGDNRDRSFLSSRGYRGVSGEGYGPNTRPTSVPGQSFDRYDRNEAFVAPDSYPWSDNDLGREFRGNTWQDREAQVRDATPRSAYFAGERTRHQDPHYQSWRQRHIDDLDRDYDDYRRENQSRFENDFGSWRERRMQKRSLLGQVREHMEVVSNDDEHIGTVDKIVRDRIILTKSDPESGGVHHSLSCSDVDRVEGDRVILDCTADQARNRWRDESRGRALFEREDQGEMGDRMLDRSFEGTYR